MNEQRRYSQHDIDRISGEAIRKMEATYRTRHNREITVKNVYQEAVLEGQADFEDFVSKFLLPGSRIAGTADLVDCMAQLEQGKTVLLLPEHRSNLDVPAFHVLFRQSCPEHVSFLPRLIYIAGRKLNESSGLVHMFTEKYSRLVIVPRRELPTATLRETLEQAETRQEHEQQAARINRAAFREMIRLRKQGKVFVLYPLGGRVKPDADNIPVRETISYLKTFDVAYLVSMEGNMLIPGPNMEEERPIQDKVIFRVGRRLETRSFLARQRELFAAAAKRGVLPLEEDFEQFAVGRIMRMLESLRVNGDYDRDFPPA